MMDLITPIVSNWVYYVFGSSFYAVLFFMFLLLVIGIKMGWSLELYAVIMIPIILIMSSIGMIPTWISGIIIVIGGIIIGLMLYYLIRR